MIGVFDSGLGGLTALRRLRQIAPKSSYVYFGDTGRVPYGTRCQETILRYALQDLAFLATFSPKAVLVACGTVSANALPALRTVAPFPVLGVIEAATEAAIRRTKNGRIGVLGTGATVRTHAYKQAILQKAPGVFVEEVACPLFVPMVENGLIDAKDPIVSAVCARYLAPLLGAGVDTVILGCTHYPLLSSAIAEIIPNASLIDPGAEAVQMMLPYIEEIPLPQQRYYVSDDADGFATAATRFLGESIVGHVQTVSVGQ